MNGRRRPSSSSRPLHEAEGLAELQAADRAAGARSCASCGCTDRWGCPGGCGWAGPELCTRCAQRLDDGVYALADGTLFLDVGELLDAHGYGDTPQNRATLEAVARERFAALGIPVVDTVNGPR